MQIETKAEAKSVFEDACDVLIVGAGQEGKVRLSPEASDYFNNNGSSGGHDQGAAQN